MSTAIRASVFSFVGTLNDLFYIPQTQSLLSWACGFNLQLCSWWEGFGSSSLATLPLGFNCGFISTSAWGSSTWVCSWGCPGGLGFALGLGFAPVRARCGGGGSQGFWQHQVLRGVGDQGSRKYSALEGDGNQYSCLDNQPSLWQRSLAGHSLQGCRVRHNGSDPACIDTRLF